MAAMAEPLDAVVLVQNVDIYYFAGTYQTCHLLIPRSGEPRLLVRRVFYRAKQDSPLGDVKEFRSLKDLPGEIESLCGPRPWRIGMELDVLPARTLDHYRGIFGESVSIRDASEAVLRVRSVKSEWELSRIREASSVVAKVFASLPEFLEDDLSTHQLQAILDCRIRLAGHPGIVRMRGFNIECSLGTVVSGPTGAAPSPSVFPVGGTGIDLAWPSGGDGERIRPDTPILCDYLGCEGGYYADQTRVAVKGRLTDEAGKIYAAMFEILRHCERTVRVGSIPSRVYVEAVAMARDAGFATGFMGLSGHAVPFVGHAVGLEVNETPVLAPKFDEPLPAGTVLAIEPKFTHPELGVIGLENTYVVRADRLECLTPLPETVTIVGR